MQRRRTAADSLEMRKFFNEGDLISAEVQNFYGDGAVALHTRSLKYGKLSYGLFVSVCQSLVKRCKQHFVSLPCDVDIVLGNNGYIWLYCTPEHSKGIMRCHMFAGPSPSPSTIPNPVSISISIPIPIPIATGTLSDHERIARVRNCIVALDAMFLSISPDTIMLCYNECVEMGLLSSTDILRDQAILTRITQKAAQSKAAKPIAL